MHDVTVTTNVEKYNRSWRFGANNTNMNMYEIESYIGVLLHVSEITKIEVVKCEK